MADFFGYCQSDGSIHQAPAATTAAYNGYIRYNRAGGITACPGTGDQEINSIGFYGYNNTTVAVHAKMLVYSSDGTAKLYTASPITIAGNDNTYAWREQTGLSGTNLTGGTSYRLAIMGDNDNVYYGRYGGPSGAEGNKSGQSYASPPTNISADSGTNDIYSYFRCGVIAAGGGAPTQDQIWPAINEQVLSGGIVGRRILHHGSSTPPPCRSRIIQQSLLSIRRRVLSQMSYVCNHNYRRGPQQHYICHPPTLRPLRIPDSLRILHQCTPNNGSQFALRFNGMDQGAWER